MVQLPGPGIGWAGLCLDLIAAAELAADTVALAALEELAELEELVAPVEAALGLVVVEEAIEEATAEPRPVLPAQLLAQVELATALSRPKTRLANV